MYSPFTEYIRERRSPREKKITLPDGYVILSSSLSLALGHTTSFNRRCTSNVVALTNNKKNSLTRVRHMNRKKSLNGQTLTRVSIFYLPHPGVNTNARRRGSHAEAYTPQSHAGSWPQGPKF